VTTSINISDSAIPMFNMLKFIFNLVSDIQSTTLIGTVVSIHIEDIISLSDFGNTAL
jgi:hypothetical protein